MELLFPSPGNRCLLVCFISAAQEHFSLRLWNWFPTLAGLLREWGGLGGPLVAPEDVSFYSGTTKHE